MFRQGKRSRPERRPPRACDRGTRQPRRSLKARVEAAGLTEQPVSTLRLSEDGSYSIRIGTSESIAYRALGVAQPEGQTDPDDFSIDVGEENLDLLDSAHTLFVYVDDTADGEREKVESSPLWKTLPAVENNRVHFVDSGVWNSAGRCDLVRVVGGLACGRSSD
ncbi:TroA family protein [Myceligenerans halotolerans]